MNDTITAQTTMLPLAPSFSQEEISTWMQTRIAEQLKVAPDEIDLDQPFASYGLDSVAAAGFSAELEEWLKIPLPPTLTWDYPTIEQLASHLAAG